MSAISTRSGTDYSIRAYQASDAAILTELYRRSVLHFGPLAYSSEQVKAWAGAISREKISASSSDGRYVIVAVDVSDTILGWGDLEADGHIDFLYSSPEAQGRRVGSALYAALEEHARATGLSRLYVEASELARHLFERRGFARSRRNDVTVGGVAIHNFSMEKLLP